MDEKNWFENRKKLSDLLKLKKDQLEQVKNDIEEIEFCIEKYGEKVGSYEPPAAEPVTGVA